MSTVIAPRRAAVPRSRMALLPVLAGLGGLVFVAGLFLSPHRVWTGFLLGFLLFTALGLAGPVFLAVLDLAGAGWAAVLRRIPEAMASTLPWAAALGLLLIAGTSSLYEWSHGTVVDADPVLQAKSVWLNLPFFAIRVLLFFAAWCLFTLAYLRRARQEDAEGPPPGFTRRRILLSAAFMAVFTVTWSLASFDWILSLEPHWFSTIYGLYALGGLGQAGLAAVILILVWRQRQGALDGALRPEHLQDLGKLLLSLSVFWAYLWYCQYMLVWYGDLPEETGWYLARRAGAWKTLTPVLLILNGFLPFLALLSRRARGSAAVLARVAGVVLAGRALDLYLLAGPPLMGGQPVLGIWEAGPLLGAGALFFHLCRRHLESVSAVPLRDPHLAESRSYHA